MNVALYTRVSTHMQAEKGISLEAQEEILAKYCNDRNYEYKIFRDPAKSGKSIEKREKLQELLNNLKDFDIIIVWKLSRLGRNMRDILNMMYEFDKNNVRFISYNENIDTSNSMSKMLMYVIGICTEIERDNTSENVKLAKRQEFENGRKTAKKVLGYDIKNKQLVINKNEANIIKFIFETYDKTHNYYQTAKICNNKGLKGKKGQQFHASSIKTIVQNQIYLGFNNFHKEEQKKGSHQAIITKNLFNKVNNIA